MEGRMRLIELTTTESEDGRRIVRVAGRIADPQASGEQGGWISFQLETDLPTARNGALLRSEVLRSVIETLSRLQRDYEHRSLER
jgi:hypothetical protein